MKANEAPEKIYVCIPDDDIVGTASTQKGFPHQFVTEEYTQTNAFIEKAVQFLKDKGSAYITIIDGQLILRKGVVKDFRKYMEGE